MHFAEKRWPRKLVAGALALALACTLSCVTPGEQLQLQDVSPHTVYFGVTERLLLRGTFSPDLAVDLDDPEASPALENRFTVKIGEVPAQAVTFRSRELLEVTSPASLPPGDHSLTVTDELGRSVTLPNALTVVDRKAHRLAFLTSMRSARPESWTQPIRLELRGADGQPVPTFLERQVVLTSDSSTGRFAVYGQEDQAQEQLEVTLRQGATGLDIVYNDTASGYHTLSAASHELDVISQTVAVGRLGPPTAVRFAQVPVEPVTAGADVAIALEVVDDSGGPASFPAKGIRLELSTSSPAGRWQHGDQPFSPNTLSLTLATPEDGRTPLVYQDRLGAPEVELSVSALNLDTGKRLAPDVVVLTVAAAPTHHFEATRGSTELLRAGTFEVFTLQAVDEFGNRTPYTGPVLLSSDPHDPDLSPRSINLTNGLSEVKVRFTVKREPVALVVTHPSNPGLTGRSVDLSVRPGSPARLAIAPVPNPVRAGESFPLALVALDAFGNTVDIPLSVKLASTVPNVVLSPSSSGTFTGSTVLPVTINTAVQELSLDLTAADWKLATRTSGFEVRPGPTQRFSIQDPPASTSYKAGVPFTALIQALDAYGNLTRDVHDLDLSAENVHAHLFFPGRLEGFQGQALVTFTVNQAIATTWLRASATSTPLKGQQKVSFQVTPGDFAKYSLSAPSCVTPNTPFRLSVTAVDTWNNKVPDYTGSAIFTLTPSTSTRLVPSAVGPFSGGTYTVLNAEVQNVPTPPPSACLTLTATDTFDSSKNGNTCLKVQSTCP
jgi:hypothetical protein